jgi:hypothetical protein
MQLTRPGDGPCASRPVKGWLLAMLALELRVAAVPLCAFDGSARLRGSEA